MAKKKKTASTGGVLGSLGTTAFSDEGAAASSLFSASEASLPPAPPAAPEALKEAQPEIMRAAGKGVIHKNTSARKISRLSARVKAMG